jgi:DNA polymerase-4
VHRLAAHGRNEQRSTDRPGLGRKANVCSTRIGAVPVPVAARTAPTVLHADLDAFYASVEQLLEPSLRGRPIAVGSGVVLAASYEARSFGVSAGMPAWRARQLCPNLRFVGGHFDRYQPIAEEVLGVFGRYTPLVERVSIDEAFLDVAGSVHLFGAPAAIAAAIRQRVRHEVGLAVSVGAATTKHLAKIASQVAKPDGMVVVTPGGEEAFLERLPVGLIWGVGPVTRQQLARAGISTIGELRTTSAGLLSRLLGASTAGRLVALAGNLDDRPVAARGRAGSVGAQAAFGRRVATRELLRSTLGYLADRVAGRLRAAGRDGRTVTVRVRFPDLRSVTRSKTVTHGLSATGRLAALAVELAETALVGHPDERQVTLLAVSVSQLVGDAAQLELPFGSAAAPRPPRSAADRSVDAIRARFGRDAIGYAGAVLGRADRVPEAFRNLAEHLP